MLTPAAGSSHAGVRLSRCLSLSRQQSRRSYRQRSLWRLLRVESSSADVLDHAAQGFRLFVGAAVCICAGAVIVVGHRRPVTHFDLATSPWAVAIVKPADWLAR